MTSSILLSSVTGLETKTDQRQVDRRKAHVLFDVSIFICPWRPSWTRNEDLKEVSRPESFYTILTKNNTLWS